MPGDSGDYGDVNAERDMEDPNKQVGDGKKQESQQEIISEGEKEKMVNDSEQDEVGTFSQEGEKELPPGEESTEADVSSEGDQSKSVTERNDINHTLRPGEEEP